MLLQIIQFKFIYAVLIKTSVPLRKNRWGDRVISVALLINSIWSERLPVHSSPGNSRDTLILAETMKCVRVTGFMAKGTAYLPQITHSPRSGWYNSVTYEIKNRNLDVLFIVPCIIWDREWLSGSHCYMKLKAFCKCIIILLRLGNSSLMKQFVV